MFPIEYAVRAERAELSICVAEIEREALHIEWPGSSRILAADW
jgi:hypothetical protein